MNQLLDYTLMNLPEDFLLIGLSFMALIFVAILFVVFLLSRLVLKLKRECANLTIIVNGNKNDIYGLCSSALTVNEKTATSYEQLHNLKQLLASVVEKMTELQQGNFENNPYNLDIRKVRGGANVEELMQQSDLSYDEAALLVRLHGNKA